jgi:hypothetical protein
MTVTLRSHSVPLLRCMNDRLWPIALATAVGRGVCLLKRTPAAGVTRPIIGSCDNVPPVRDTHRWRPLSKKAAVTADMI